MPPTDALARHLALLLSVADLDARLRPARDEVAALGASLAVTRRAAGASRVSLFDLTIADDDLTGVAVTRVARATLEPDDVVPLAAFAPAYTALLIACAQTAAAEALGPLADDEPFYAAHHHQEPTPTRFAAFAPIVEGGRVVGVIEAARGPGGAPFDGDALGALEDGALAVAAVAAGARRERTIEAIFADLLPELLDRERAPTSLPARLRTWFAERRLNPLDREALALATSIAELTTLAPAALPLAHTVVAAVARAFAEGGPSGAYGRGVSEGGLSGAYGRAAR